MLLLEFEEFGLPVGGCHGRNAARADGVHGSVEIRTMSKLGRFSHQDQAKVGVVKGRLSNC